ncbi:conserved exported hypothetical protein [Candidatus Zixiibacteriota bacterium]|nr:conserved exported hypothetical protein [candidate division Zixibacteria bacterium]
MKKSLIVAITLASALLFIGAEQPGKGVTEQDFQLFLKDFETKVMPLSKESALSGYNASLSGKDADYEKSAQASLAIGKIYSDPALFARIKEFKEGKQIADPLLVRQLDILYLSFLGSQIDPQMLEELIRRSTAISQKFYTYRTKVGERTLSDNQVDSILRYSTDSKELEDTWKASKLIGSEIAPALIELVKLRNQAARKIGFDNYYEMNMKLSEQDPVEIAALFDQLDSLTQEPFAVAKTQIDSALAIRYGIAKDKLEPWHYQNRFFQEAPSIYAVDFDSYYRDKDPVAIVKKYFAGIGLPVDSILAHSDLYERPGKYQHAYSTDIDREGDVRIVCNVRPDCGWTGTLLHELGHGVYDYYGDRQLPWMLRGSAHAFTTEAVANFFGRLAENPQWLIDIVGAPKNYIDPVAGDCLRSQNLTQLVFNRWAQVMVRFERAMYENPDQDLNKLWWQMVEKYQGVKCPEGRNEADWASKIHLTDAPVYYHNYLIAELLASQFAEAIGTKVLKIPEPFNADFANNPKIGEYFVDNVFYPGARYTWNEMIERATGEKLTSVYYARQFMGRK